MQVMSEWRPPIKFLASQQAFSLQRKLLIHPLAHLIVFTFNIPVLVLIFVLVIVLNDPLKILKLYYFDAVLVSNYALVPIAKAGF